MQKILIVEDDIDIQDGTDFFRIQPLPLIAVKLQSSFCFNTSESMSTL